jgi:MFS family permease
MISGVLILIGFYFWEQRMVAREKTPLVAMKLFANKQFTAGASLSMLMSVGQVGLIFGLPVFLQGVRGLDALHTGYALLPMSVGLFLLAPMGGYLAKHFKPKHIVQTGLLLNILALILLRHAFSVTAGAAQFALPLFLYGAGFGLTFAQLSNITLSAVSVNEAGEASGVNNTLRQVGSSFGTAIIGSVIIATIASGLVGGIRTTNELPANKRDAIATAVSSQTSNVEFGIPLQGDQLTSAEKQTIKRISDESTVRADHHAVLIMIGFSVLALVVSSRLPNVDISEIEHKETAPKVAAAH